MLSISQSDDRDSCIHIIGWFVKSYSMTLSTDRIFCWISSLKRSYCDDSTTLASELVNTSCLGHGLLIMMWTNAASTTGCYEPCSRVYETDSSWMSDPFWTPGCIMWLRDEITPCVVNERFLFSLCLIKMWLFLFLLSIMLILNRSYCYCTLNFVPVVTDRFIALHSFTWFHVQHLCFTHA